jgi:hypothetical protein
MTLDVIFALLSLTCVVIGLIRLLASVKPTPVINAEDQEKV